MGKSISTTSNTNTTTNPAPASFKAGDAVLCPSIGTGSYTLCKHDSKRLAIRIGDNCQVFNLDGRINKADAMPSIFHDTPANRQAIAVLFGKANSQRKIIDTTTAHDDEVILLSSHDLSHIACDIQGAITVLDDIGQLLALIHYEKIEAHTAIALARLTHDAAVTWSNLLHDQLESINDPLAQTAYGKEGA